jgi:hypothetical protein
MSPSREATVDFDDNGDIRTEYRGLRTKIDATRRLVWQQDRVVAQFRDVSGVSVEPGAEEDGAYHVQLHAARRGVVSVGHTDIDVDASVLAARIATLIGVPVKAYPGAPKPVIFWALPRQCCLTPRSRRRPTTAAPV